MSLHLISSSGPQSTVNRDQNGFVAGLSSAMQALESVIVGVAPTNIPILFVGESGTGKEVFANRVHKLSRHSKEPLLKISCASMNPATLSTALRLNSNSSSENASPGTVFLDEISELDASCQRNLLCA